MNENQKNKIILQIQNAGSVYSILSLCTGAPYIVCDEETYDDQIYIYFNKRDAQKKIDELTSQKIPTRMTEIPKSIYIPFYSSLFSMGVNRIVVDAGTDRETGIQLGELIKRAETPDGGENPAIIENPALHLTALYYMQEMKRDPKASGREDMKELYEEMLNHFQKGKYLIPAREGSQEVPLLKQQSGDMFYPVFTDAMEFRKFCTVHKEEKWKTGIVEASNLHKIIPDGVKGVAVNPMGVNLLLQIIKK